MQVRKEENRTCAGKCFMEGKYQSNPFGYDMPVSCTTSDWIQLSVVLYSQPCNPQTLWLELGFPAHLMQRGFLLPRWQMPTLPAQKIIFFLIWPKHKSTNKWLANDNFAIKTGEVLPFISSCEVDSFFFFPLKSLHFPLFMPWEVPFQQWQTDYPPFSLFTSRVCFPLNGQTPQPLNPSKAHKYHQLAD